jgi:predicted TIM-barrel fold metal-dependent hydrolase
MMAQTMNKPARAMDPIHHTVLNGQPIEVPVIDCHAHFGLWPNTTVPDSVDRAKVLRAMDAWGIDLVVFSASSPGYAGDLSSANDRVIDFVQAVPERIMGYCTLSANHPQGNLAELERCYDAGLRFGVKMHRYKQPAYKISDRFLDPVFAFLNERHLVYLNHDLGSLDEIRTAAERWPGVTFMNGHGSIEIAALAQAVPNVRANSCAMIHYGDIARLVEAHGSHSLLLGSDFNLFQPGFGIGPVAYAQISEDAKRDILGRNAIEIMKDMAWYSEDNPLASDNDCRHR